MATEISPNSVLLSGNPDHRPIHTGLDFCSHRALGAWKRRSVIRESFLRRADVIADRGSSLRHTSARHLRESLSDSLPHFRKRSEPPVNVVDEVLAVLREVANREVGLTPYPVQLAGALALHEGYLTEMATGEGKTLTAGLAAVLSGLRNRPCHVITANDYLASRDCAWLRPLYAFAGLQSGFVVSELDRASRRKAYAAHITYTTSKEVVADYMRDQLLLGVFKNDTLRRVRYLQNPGHWMHKGLALRGLYSAIVDEADHLLIDEAVTPVIICQPYEDKMLLSVSREAAELSEDFVLDTDYVVSDQYREIELLSTGHRKVAAIAREKSGVWRSAPRCWELVRQALEAKHFFLRGKQYLVQDEKIAIVDEFSGRVMPSRSWRAGLHQAIEASEGLDLSDPTETSMRLSLQRFFRYYPRLSGMTGTASESSEEFWQVYHLPVVSIPTNRPDIRLQYPSKYFVSEDDKWLAVVDEIVAVHETGRPVLAGLRTVKQSERLSRDLTAAGIEHTVLNAERHKEESQIIAEAGKRGHVTIATNMAGRGTDILLGEGVSDDGGLHVVLCERYESARIDRQFVGRCARQGDPGSYRLFASLDDDVIVKNFTHRIIQLLKSSLTDSDASGGNHSWDFIYYHAQNISERQSAKQRKSILKLDEWSASSLPFQ